MAHGIAVRIGPAPARFHQHSTIFRLHPSLGQSETERATVVVAVTPRAVDHGRAETTVFFTEADGDPARYNGLEHAEALEQELRVIGEQSVAAGLRNLRYIEVPEARLAELQAIGVSRAVAWAEANFVEDPQDYGSNNWGMFAARHLVEEEGLDDPVPVPNSLAWPALQPLTGRIHCH